MASEQPPEQWSQLVQAIKDTVAGMAFDGDQQAITHVRTTKRFVDAARSSFANKPALAVLDTATAGGEPGLSIAQALPQAEITLTDYSPACVAWAKERADDLGLGPRISAAVANAESMPQYADGSFDIVTCSYGLMFFDHVKGLREMHRVLRPGGLLLVANWGPAEELDFTKVLQGVSSGLYLSGLDVKCNHNANSHVQAS